MCIHTHIYIYTHRYTCISQNMHIHTLMHIYACIYTGCIKNYFKGGLDLAGVEKGEVILDIAAPKSDFLSLTRTTIEPSHEFGDQTDDTKNLS